jgi:hypothetical protein
LKDSIFEYCSRATSSDKYYLCRLFHKLTYITRHN